MSARVLVVGDVMVDVVVKPTAPVAPTSDTPSRVRVGRGGSGANIALQLAAAGHEVTYVGAVGADALGELFRAELASAGVTARLQVAGRATGVVVAVVAPDGERAMMTDRGANAMLVMNEDVAELVTRADHVHVSGYTVLDEHTRAVASAVLALANESDVATSLDVCSVGPLAEVTPEAFLAAGAGASLLFANEEEALTLTRSNELTSALEWLGQRFAEVVVTRGARGASAVRDGATSAIAARATEVRDTTGAGDAATGAYLAARLSGHDVLESLSRAMRQASVVVRELGARG